MAEGHISIGLVSYVISLLVAVAASVLITIYVLRDNSIESCKLNSASKIIDARFFQGASNTRQALADKGSDVEINEKTAAEYAEYANDKRATIPYIWQNNEERGENEIGRIQGCEHLNPPPIPFIK